MTQEQTNRMIAEAIERERATPVSRIIAALRKAGLGHCIQPVSRVEEMKRELWRLGVARHARRRV